MAKAVEPKNDFDLAAFILVSFIQLLLLIWWIYILYCSNSKNNINEHAGSPTSKSTSSKETSKNTENSIPTSTDAQTSNNNDNKIEIEMYNQATKNKKAKKIDQEMVVKMEKLPKLLSTLSIVLSTLNLCVSITVFIWDPALTIECIIFSLNMAFAFWARGCLYFYYIERIKIAFDNSLWALKPLKHKIIVIWITLGYISAGIWYNVIILEQLCDTDYVGLALLWPLLNEISVSSFCLIYFIYKLRKLLKSTSSTSPEEATKRIKYIMRKLTALTIVTITTSSLSVMIGLSGYQVSIAIDSFINNICLMLSFGFLDHFYRIFCCVCLKCCK